MSDNLGYEFNTTANYNLVFIPFIDKDEERVKWAVYDTKFTSELDSTTLLLDAITHEIEDKHAYITKDRLDAQAYTHEASSIFDCDDENAIEYLQNLLGEFDADEYLSRFGFTDGKEHGFSINPENLDTQETTNDPDNNEIIQEEQESSAEFNSAGSVPVRDDKYWNTRDACNLLRSALVFKQREIDNNVKGSVKEAVSDALAVYATVTATTGPSIYATISGAVAIALMGYNAMQDAKDRDEILKDWALFQKDRNNPDVSSEQAADNLKIHMKNSSFAYEGVPANIPYKEYTKYKPFFNKLAELQGLYDATNNTNSDNKINASKVKAIGERVRAIKPKAAKIFGLNLFRTKNMARLTKEGVVEVGTDLKHLFNFKDSSMRTKMYNDIKGAGRVTAKDLRHRQKNKHKKEEEAKHHQIATKSIDKIKESNNRAQSKYQRIEDDNIQTEPEIIHAEIDYVSYERHIETLEQLPGLRRDKAWAKGNYANVSTSMMAQMSGLINGVLTLNPIETLSNAYGILTGIGAYAQTASNVLKIDDKTHGKLAESAEHHEYVREMQTQRLVSNLAKKNLHVTEKPKKTPEATKILDDHSL